MAKDPFPKPSPLDFVLLRELAAVAKACYDRGWSYGTAGNFSLRGSAPHLIWQSPGGVPKDSLEAERFIPVNLSSGECAEPGDIKVSGEMPVHLGIYRTLASAKSVVHCHPHHLVAFTAGRSSALQFQGEEMQKAIGCDSHSEVLKIPMVTNIEPEAMPAFANEVGEVIDASIPMVVLQHHGVYAWGKSPLAALAVIEALEHLCQTEMLKS